MATLVLQLADGLRQWPLTDGCVLGRSAQSEVVVEHSTISRKHARFQVGDDGVWVEDLGGANGTRVNGITVRGMPEIVTDGASVRFGFVSGWIFVEEAPAKLANGTKPTCAICSWDVEPEQELHRCEECGAEYHADCWADNQGCATYGCAGARSPDEDDVHVEADLEIVGEPTLPVPYLLLAGSLVGTLAGLVLFGVPALIAAGVAAMNLKTGGQVVLAAVIVGVVGAIAGVGVSWFWWLAGPTL